MTRRTRGREVAAAPHARPGSFSAALVDALERSAGRQRTDPAGCAGHVRADVGSAHERTLAHAAVPVTAAAHGTVSERSGTGSSRIGVAGSGPLGRRPAVSVVQGLPVSTTADPSGPGATDGAATAADPDDTPGPDPDHLIEVVGVEAMPLWLTHLRAPHPESRERLVEHYGSLVRGVATKLAVRLPASIELADLVQSGTFGLMDAVDRFDPWRAVRFDGYAAQRVRGAMLDELRAQDWVPRTVRARTREVERAREAVALRTGRAATDRELAVELGIGMRELRHAVRPVHLVSVEMLEQNADGGPGVGDLVADDTAPDPVLVAVRRETSRELGAAVAQLGERDRLVLRLYYLENRTLAEIGAMLGVTESRVCQLHSRIVSRLRGRLQPLQAC